jgi:hypothetical protein
MPCSSLIEASDSDPSNKEGISMSEAEWRCQQRIFCLFVVGDERPGVVEKMW